MSQSGPLQQSTPPSSESGYLTTSSSFFGRPLSLIESTGSYTDEEDVFNGKHNRQISGRSEPESNQADLETQIIELLKISHDLAAEEYDASDLPAQSKDDNSILLKDLPNLLAEFEKIKGRALLNEEARPVLEQYVEASPDLPLKADTLQEMIAMLNNSREDTEDEAKGKINPNPEGRELWMEEITEERRPKSYTSESDTDHSTEEDESQSDGHGPPRRPSTFVKRRFEFPRSQSERLELSSGSSKTHNSQNTPTKANNPRKKTTSDPSAPLSETRTPLNSQNRGKTERRKSGEAGSNRDILTGKGKAKVPPSSWANARPRPPGLVKRERNRRVSDLSSNLSDDFEQENSIGTTSPLPTSASYQDRLGMGIPSEPFGRNPRQRLLSQPDPRAEMANGKFSRSNSSTSAGFAFPQSYGNGSEDGKDGYRGDQWERLCGELGSSPLPRSISGASLPRSSSSRAASPSLDESSYHNFSALSPTINNDYATSPTSPTRDIGRGSSRRSSAAGRRRNLENDEGDMTMMLQEDSIAIRARLEAVQRLLSEKERQHDGVQQEHEMFISRLQDELEDSKAEISTRKREEKESKAREINHMDTIASLEADLNKTEKALTTTREQLSKSRADYDEQVAETDRLRLKINGLQEELQKVKVEEAVYAENARAWEGDREVYREKINELHAHIDGVEVEVSKLQESERENRVLKEQIERMTLDMEDVRRGSNLLGSRLVDSEADTATLSKRLGSELAKQLSMKTEIDSSDQDTTSGDGDETDEGNETAQFVINVKQERSTKSRKRKEDKQIVAPPTYDEAALELQVSNRLHPRIAIEGEESTGKEVEASEAEVKDVAYQAMILKTGVRCTVLEQNLRMHDHTQHPTPEETTKSELKRSNAEDLDTRMLQMTVKGLNFIHQRLDSLPFSTPTKSMIGKVKESERHQWLLLSLIVFAIGLLLGWGYPLLSARSTPTLYHLEEFGVSKSLGIHGLSIPGTGSSWHDMWRSSTNGRPLSRIPT